MWRYKADIPEEHYQNQCVKLLLQKLGAIMFNYDLRTDNMSFRLTRGGMHARDIEGFRRTMNAERRLMVHPDFLEQMIAFFSGQSTESDSFLLDMGNPPTGKYSWYKFVVERESDEHGHLAIVRGVMWRTDRLHEAAKEGGRFRSELDSVTGVANENGLIAEADRCLTGEGKKDVNALVLVRLERYEDLEKRLGKRGAETLLVRLCNAIGGKFRSGDVLAHLGNGLFAVFVRDVTSKPLLELNAKGIEAIFRPGNVEYGKYGITCRITLAYSPEDGTRCRDLLEAAREKPPLPGSAGNSFMA